MITMLKEKKTHTLSRIDRIRDICTMNLVNARVRTRYAVDRSKPTATTKSRRYTVCLPVGSRQPPAVPTPIRSDTTYLFNVMDVPVLSSPRPPPSPPWDIQVESANADTTQNPTNYSSERWWRTNWRRHSDQAPAREKTQDGSLQHW